MAIRTRRFNQKGYTLIEMAIATLIMGIMATTVIMANRFANQQGVANQDRTFASEKAIQMYEELRTLVNGNENGTHVLDSYSNGNTYDTVLTTDVHVDTGLTTANPADPLSGNFKTDGNWRYARQVEVDMVANDTQARKVTVKVYLYPGDFSVTSAHTPGILLATVGGILRTSQMPNVATQVLDVYILQINNIPSWWSVLPTLASDMQADVIDLESRLQGVQLRTHFITRTSYGRDYYYQPNTNSSTYPVESSHQKWLYFYPGWSPQTNDGSAIADGYYFDSQTSGDPNSLLTTGNFMVDGTSYPVATSLFDNEVSASYSVADQYNNAMRYPDELATYQAVTTAYGVAAAQGVTAPAGVTEISERMLLEGMLSQPASFQNAIIVNLHGELLPLPPMRNYSDAAKDPGNQLATAVSVNNIPVTCAIVAANGVTGDMNVRVVTHPELLYYPGAVTTSTAVTVRLRVYAYYDSEDVGGSAGLPTGDPRVPAISVFLPDASATILGVTANIGSSTIKYNAVGASAAYTTPPSTYYSGAISGDAAGNPMSMSVSYIGPVVGSTEQTLITLYNTPLRCPIYSSGAFGGLNPADMLYGLEYIPCSPNVTTSTLGTSYTNNGYVFGNDLGTDNAVTASGNPKNTARWIITLGMPVTSILNQTATIYGGVYTAPATIAGQHAIETRLGNGVTSSTFVNNSNLPITILSNLSRTYVWCGDATMPPYTEQYQFLGDPRDCPYYDVKVGGVSINYAAVTIGPNAYNWWFKGSSAGTSGMASDGYAGFGQAGASIWSGSSNGPSGNLQVDLPRYYQIIRQGLLKTTSIWTGTNGWSWFYFGIGGEFGSDQDPRQNGIVMYDDLFRTSGTAVTAGFNGIYSGDGADGSFGNGLWVASNSTGSNSVTWYQRSWLGELYPDKSYLTQWVSFGNLPSYAHSGSVSETFYLEPMSKVKTSGPSGSSDDGFAGVTFWPNPGGYGSEAFYNGQNTTSHATFEHLGTDNNGNELALGVTTYNIIPFPLPSVVDVNREWDFNGTNPPSSAFAPYNSAAMTTTLTVPSVTNATGGGVTARYFYDYNGTGSYPPTSPYGSGVVKMQQVNGGTTQVGYVVETGLAPSGSVGAQTLAEMSLVFGMRTFLDGGQMAATNVPGHIVQIPLVKIFLASPVPEYNASESISFTVGCPVTATSNGGGAVSVGMPVTDLWWRFDPSGLASYYTEEYPQASLPMTTESGMYQEAVSVVYNLKYSGNAGKTWYYVQDPQDVSNVAVTGVCNSAASYAITNVAPWTYNFPVASGSVTLPQGDYELMVEAYRQNYGLHYSYDIQNLQVSW